MRVDADGVEVEVETPDGRYGTRCRYLVGADGAHSIVREKIGAKDAESALFENHWCIADVRIAASEKAVRKAYLDNPLNEGGAIWYHQMADGVWRTDWLIGHYADPDAEATPARATERLKKLLGPDTPFEIVWVGPWRFRKRYVERMVHGRVCLLGDAAAQHSPFGARGGNRAVQDANNLAWKLALVLEGKAHPDLIETYHAERHHAARECVELASRSALFIGPESEGQRLVRDAILDLAQAHAWARPLVNTGRLSVATDLHRVTAQCLGRRCIRRAGRTARCGRAGRRAAAGRPCHASGGAAPGTVQRGVFHRCAGRPVQSISPVCRSRCCVSVAAKRAAACSIAMA